MKSHKILLIILVFVKVQGVLASESAYRLYEELFHLSGYNKIVRPVFNHSQPLTVRIKLKLTQIIAVHEKSQIMTTNVWLYQEWHDNKLTWNPEFHDGIQFIYVPVEHIWLPDVVLYNNADGNYHVNTMSRATVFFNGTVVWEPPAIYKSMCEMNIKWFPYDYQICSLKFGSWAYDGSMMDLVHWYSDDKVQVTVNKHGETVWVVAEAIDLSGYYPSVEWDLMAVPGERHSLLYPSHPYPFCDITYYIHLRRKQLFYTVNLVVPCAGISILTMLVFYLPADSYEKIVLCVSVFISLNVFFLLLVDLIPSTSLVVPMIGRYLIFTTTLVSLSIVATVCTVELHYRSSSTHVMSTWVSKIFLDFLPKVLFMQRRYVAWDRRFSASIASSSQSSPSSASDFLSGHLDKPTLDRIHKRIYQNLVKVPTVVWPNQIHSGNQSTENLFSRAKQESVVSKSVRKFANNISFIAHKIHRHEQEAQIAEDWKFVAMVLDQIFLILFSIACVGGTASIILMAPSLYDMNKPIR